MNSFNKRLDDLQRQMKTVQQEYDVAFPDGSHRQMNVLDLLLYTMSMARGENPPYVEYKEVYDLPNKFTAIIDVVEQLRQ